MAESWKTRAQRIALSLLPAIRGTGARITYVAADWGEVRVRLPLNLWTRNYVVMLYQRLGKGYVVWDKAASIRF